MPYMEKKILSGKYLEVERYPVSNTGKRLSRGEKGKPTNEAQKKLNEKNARKKLTRLMNTNFTEGDIFLTLTYKNKDVITEQEAKKELTNYIRRLKTYREKKGLAELKYIAVSETDKKDGYHHHLVVSGSGMTRDEIEGVWRKGRTKTSYLVDGENGLEELAKYFLKNQKDIEPNKRKWTQSNNLLKPKVTVKSIKRVNAKKDPKPPKGYFLVKSEISVNDYSGAIYQYIYFKKIE